jgi:hypothetical protein
VQGLSFFSLIINTEISGITLTYRMETVVLVAAGAIFFTTGIAVAAVIMRFSRKPSLISIRSYVDPDIFNRRALRLILISDILLLVMVLSFGSLRRDVFVGLFSLLSIPLSLIVTKVPLLYALSRPRLTAGDMALLIVHYIFLALAYESKMGLIYVVLVAFLFLRLRQIVIVSVSVALGVGLMISWAVITADGSDSVDIGYLLHLALESFLNRFDSIRVALLVFESNSNTLAVRNIFGALATLMPGCSATQGCLNLTAQISQQIIGIDVSVAVYEINIATEAAILTDDIFIPIYTLSAGFLAQWITGVFSLRFHSNQLQLPVSSVCFVLLPCSLWSAGLFSTRVVPFFILELLIMGLLIKFLARRKMRVIL